MAERQKRRRFTTEFKAEAVRRLLDGGKGLGEVATELGLSPGQLSGWRNEHLAAGSAEALAQRKAEQAETQRLKREVKRLEEEVEVLSSTLAILGRLKDRGPGLSGPGAAPPRTRPAPSGPAPPPRGRPRSRTGDRRRPGPASRA